MQEEITQKTIALVFRAASFTAKHFEAVLREAKRDLESSALHRGHGQSASNRRRGPSNRKHGRMKVSELVGDGQGATSIQIPDDIKGFENIARKYNVDFAIKKDKSVDPPKYIVFFKAKDTDVLKECFKDYLEQQNRKKSITPFKEQLKQFKEKAKKMNKTLEKKLHRGERSL